MKGANISEGHSTSCAEQKYLREPDGFHFISLVCMKLPDHNDWESRSITETKHFNTNILFLISNKGWNSLCLRPLSIKLVVMNTPYQDTDIFFLQVWYVVMLLRTSCNKNLTAAEVALRDLFRSKSRSIQAIKKYHWGMIWTWKADYLSVTIFQIAASTVGI